MSQTLVSGKPPPTRFATLLRHHMGVGTRPAGKRGSGAWTSDALAAAISVSRRTIENYLNGTTLPPDATGLSDTFFGDDPRHAVKRNNFFIAFAKATGTDPPPWAFAVSNIPIRVPEHFLGREQELTAIEHSLNRDESRGVITVLHGLRGVGKTTLAAAFANRHRADYRAIWWLRGQTRSALCVDLVSLGVKLGWIAMDVKEEVGYAAVMERLCHEGAGILLIYDNTMDARALRPYLPNSGAAKALVTSNAHAWRGAAAPIEIGVWRREIGAEYLIARTGRTTEQTAAEALSDALGGLPLALEQAAAYCERLHISLPEYHRRFEAMPVQLLDDSKDAPVDYYDGLTVAKTFGLAIEQAAVLHSAAGRLILLAALLASEPIPLYLFREGIKTLGEPLTSALAGDGLDEALAALSTFALIGRETIVDERDINVTTDCIRLHRLVRQVAVVRWSDADREVALVALVGAMRVVYPENVYTNPISWPRARRLDAAALLLVTGTDLAAASSLDASHLLDRLASYRQGGLGNYDEARPLFERALVIRKRLLGLNHPDTAMSFNNLALLLQEQGDLSNAAELHRQALTIRERVLGLEHPETALSFNNLGLVLEAEGNYSGARPLFERALAIYEQVFGPDHADTAMSLNNLGFVLQKQGDFSGAGRNYERALAIRKKVLGHNHPRTATCLNNLAFLLQLQNDLAGARSMYQQALEIYKQALGPAHPITNRALRHLGVVIFQTGSAAEAYALGQAALTAHEAALGLEHPWTRDSASLTVDALDELGQSAEAEKVRERFKLSPPS